MFLAKCYSVMLSLGLIILISLPLLRSSGYSVQAALCFVELFAWYTSNTSRQLRICKHLNEINKP